jgi:hypothetical protein
MFPTLALDKMFEQMLAGVLNTVINENIDNPYLKAALSPIVDTFSQGILNGSTPESVGQNTYEVVQKMPAKARLPELAQASAQDFSQMYVSHLLQAGQVPNAGLALS